MHLDATSINDEKHTCRTGYIKTVLYKYFITIQLIVL
jgi:hypothetical protein